MAFTASTMLELLVMITWKCLATPFRSKNGLFTQILPREAVLSEIVSTVPFVFCAGLFDAIQGIRDTTPAY